MKYLTIVLPIFAFILLSHTELDAQRRGPFGAFPQKKVQTINTLLEKAHQDREMLVNTYNGKPADLDSMFRTIFTGYEQLATQAFQTEGLAWQTVWDSRNQKSQKKQNYATEYRIIHKKKKKYDDGIITWYETCFNQTYIASYKANQVALGADAARGIAVQTAVTAFLKGSGGKPGFFDMQKTIFLEIIKRGGFCLFPYLENLIPAHLRQVGLEGGGFPFVKNFSETCNCVTYYYFCVTFYYFFQVMATITTRVDDTLKREAQLLAKELGINLSTLVTVWMKEFVRNKRLSVGLSEDHYEYYVNNPDYIQVDEPLDSFHSYLTALVKKDEQSAGKVS